MADEFVDPLNPDPTPRKKLVLFFLIDTSGSMTGSKIGQVNQAVEEALPKIRNLGGSDADIYFAPIVFGEKVEWVYESPQSVETARWDRISANGMTPLGAAFREVNKKMSRAAYLTSPHGSFAPVVFLLTDGYPNDDWITGLKLLKNNKWFKKALKIAVGVGNDADMDMLRQFVNDPELAIMLTNGENLSKLIQFILVTSSEIGSQSLGFEDDDSEDDDKSDDDTDEESKENKAKTQAMVDQVKNFKSEDFDQINDGF